MKCPKCKKQLESCVFDREYDSPCSWCGYEYSIQEMRKGMEPEDCLLVREGEIDCEEFDSDYHCQDCSADCILARSVIDDFDYVQDEEGNFGYDD